MWLSRIDNARLAVILSLLVLVLAGCTSAPTTPTVPVTQQSNDLSPVSSKPFLRLETGMHTAQIMRIAVDPQERYLVTASDDKTARVWELATGRLLQILRPPIGAGNEGLLYAVAITPDGETIAVGGWTGPSGASKNIYFFDRQSGQLKQTIGHLPNVIHHLAYSADGSYLAAALGGNNGIRIYRSPELAEVASDTDYGSDSCWVEFDDQGRLVTSSYDGYIRLYSADFKLLARKTAPGGKQPFAVRFPPQGDKLAVGFGDSTAVNVLSGQDLSFLYTPYTANANNGDLGSVAWSQDGQVLYAGGKYDDPTGNNLIMRWPQAGRGAPSAWPVATDTIMDIRSLGNRRLVFGAGYPSAGLLDSNGHKVWQHNLSIVDHRGNGNELHVSNDANLIAFGFDTVSETGSKNERPGRFDLNLLRLDVPAMGAANAKLSRPITNAPGLIITDWYNTTEPKINGQKIALDLYETSRSLAVATDRQHFLLGADWSLRFFDRQGRQQWQTPIPSVAWAVNISGDGKLAVAALGDGTIRWYRLDYGKEVLALFPHADGKRWVAWTPEGFFSDGGSGGQDLIEYHLNQGPDRERQVVQVEQLYDLFYRPDLVAKALSEDGRREIQLAVSKIGDVRQVLAGGLPPEVEIVSQKVDGLNLELELKLTDRGGGIGNLVYRVNGVEQAGRGVPVTTPGFTKVSIPLALRNNEVSITAYNSQNTIESRTAKAEPIFIDAVAINKPSLYALAVGVSQYRNPRMKLKYAADDAKAMSAALQQHGTRLFEKIEIIPLTDREATLANITATFAQLARKVKENDVFLLYLAGHGLVIQGAYHFIPQDAIYTSEQHMQEASLNESKLRELLKTIVSNKSLIILDTCYSGGALQLASATSNIIARGGLDELTAITKLNRATGRAVLAASSDQQLAFEGYNGHGFFTSALLEGLSGNADANRDYEINLLELVNFVEDRVPKISNDRQFPIHELRGSGFAVGTTE